MPGKVALRDSKDVDGAVLIFDREVFVRFIEDIKRGEYDL